MQKMLMRIGTTEKSTLVQVVRDACDKALICCPQPVPLTLKIHRSAVEISARFGYSIYDGLITPQRSRRAAQFSIPMTCRMDRR
jgi:hypothetical protein